MGKRFFAAAACSMLMVSCVLGGGCAGDEGVAAKYGDDVVTEEQVNDYTADFRAGHSYEDDRTWAEYLYEQGLTAATWRNRAIGTIVEERLLDARAAELGIGVDFGLVEDQLASDKASAGIDVQDDEGWERYLEALGTTADDYRANIEQASVRYQLIRQEVSLDEIEDSGLLDAYIEENLVSRVARRYKALCFDAEQAAQEALGSLSGLAGDGLMRAFDALLEQDDSAETTRENGGDAGWDIAGSWGDMQYELNEEMVAPGSLSTQVHGDDGKYYVMLCTDRFEFGPDTGYDDLPDDELKAYVYEMATYSSWSDLTDAYVSKMRDDANVRVHAMPDSVPYDVDYMIKEDSGGDADGAVATEDADASEKTDDTPTPASSSASVEGA